MKTHVHSKARGTNRVNNQQVVFELKHRVVLALNKLADRDTCQIGVEELDKTIECLTPDGIAPFISCILDTDSEQKSTVRKECVRMMGTLASFHDGLLGPHLGKMVASIVKRLKDPDSVVQDACVEAMGVLASKMCSAEGQSEAIFVALVRPLFEALGEQNKQLQSGSALCLARVIDNAHDPPLSVLQRILSKTIKFLKNSHFMAKPAVIELNRSIIQAGGAPTQAFLSAAITSIQETLKSSDWTTRKAASAALGEIASSGGSFFGSFKSSCIHSLESCRFDKVKPVRDTVLHALYIWRNLPGIGTPEPSEAGSCIKENFCGVDYGDSTSVNGSTSKGSRLGKAGTERVKRSPLSATKVGQNFVDKLLHRKGNDWHIEVAVQKTQNAPVADVPNEESDGSSVTKTGERTPADVTSNNIPYEFVPMDNKQECSSVCNIFSDNFGTKVMTNCHGNIEDGLVKQIETRHRFPVEEINIEEQRYLGKVRDSRSSDSTMTEASTQVMHGYCLQTPNEIISIRKQLVEIENKQSNLMDLLTDFTSRTMCSLSTIQLKVSSLEYMVDSMAHDLSQGGRYSELPTNKVLRRSPSLATPRLLTCTHRPSVDIHNRQPPPTLPTKGNEIWEEKIFASSRTSSSSKQGADMWMDSTARQNRDFLSKGPMRNSTQRTNVCQTRKTDAGIVRSSTTRAIQNSPKMKNTLWKLVKGYLSAGDLDTAYMEALCSGDELVLIDLLDRTGPVLESLSHKTTSDLLSTLASYLLDQRFMNSIIPWLQQVVDLSIAHGPHYLILSAKTRNEFLSAIQEAVNMEFSIPSERRSVTQLAMKLRQIWGK